MSTRTTKPERNNLHITLETRVQSRVETLLHDFLSRMLYAWIQFLRAYVLEYSVSGRRCGTNIYRHVPSIVKGRYTTEGLTDSKWLQSELRALSRCRGIYGLTKSIIFQHFVERNRGGEPRCSLSNSQSDAWPYAFKPTRTASSKQNQYPENDF